MTNNANRTSLSGTESGGGAGGREVNTGVLGAVTSAAVGFSAAANFVNNEGMFLLVIATQILPSQAQRLLQAEVSTYALGLELFLLEIRASRLGQSSSGN